MTLPLQMLASFAAAAAGCFVTAFWQGLLLVAFVGLLLRLLPGQSPRVRSTVWGAVMLVLLLLPMWSVWAFIGDPGAPSTGSPHGPVHLAQRWAISLTCLWLALSLTRLTQLLRSVVRLRQVARRSVILDYGFTLGDFSSPRHHQVQLCSSADVDRPSVVGFFRPRILLPNGLFERLTSAELRLILLHEAEHLRRRDDWTNLLQKLAIAVFPLNPALLWLDRRMSLEHELACDDRVLGASGTRKSYAQCLVKLADRSLERKPVSLTLGAWDGRSELAQRVARVLTRPERTGTQRQTQLQGALIGLAVLSAAVVFAGMPPLVRFDHGGAPAREGSMGSPDAASLSSFSGARAVDVSAVLPQHSAVARKPNLAAAVALHHRPRSQRMGPRRIGSGSELVLTRWQDRQPPGVVRLTVYQNSRISETTVQLVDGWLIVQL